MTSSISCSVVRRASYKPAVGGRVNLNGSAEFSVTMPSNVQLPLRLPFAHMIPAVLRPIALPPALDGRMFVERALPGRLAFAVASFDVVASATRLAMYVFHAMP